ncbi:diaminopimelate epimerase [Leeuwenhoekiella parthenopeia]|uniref:Diaminopimelate epimerase n=1 Tax=Leeuwenhoekiella parthenopeia TaxID=2890320 RepID=A0ABS8GQW9_9FLAO|nr:diaminopimelate epimerase [Leeuwenhoekiella parthenopeia]MCC4212389.1 diaminopimelate epimerase [Leeuwenhoekiella parthenopeia]
MAIPFYKYQGTGNDFIMIDNRQQLFSKNDTKLVKWMCDRKFGIGADGLILLENHPTLDFTMVYYNADGNPSSMCGNGGRCIVAFAKQLGVITDQTVFEAVDGLHEAFIKNDLVHLKMQDVSSITRYENHMFLNTGSPHHVQWVNDLAAFDVKTEGALLRYGDLYGKAGSNINFVEQTGDSFAMRTYERGVEDETLSCGTGATAVALAIHHQGKTNSHEVDLRVEGGRLKVTFEPAGTGYNNIFLIGPAKPVYTGVWPD